MAHFSKTTAAITLALPLLAASTTLSADTKYSGHELIRGLYIAADAQSGPLAQDYSIAREMLYLEKDDGTKVFMTQYDFSPMWNVRPYLYDSNFPQGAALGELDGAKPVDRQFLKAEGDLQCSVVERRGAV